MTASPLGLTLAELEQRGATATAREIAQQPAIWLEVARLVRREQQRIQAFLAPLLADSRLRCVLTGAGTSAFIGDCLAPVLLARVGRRTESIATTDIVSGPTLHLDRDVPTLIVSFARSGNSPESVAAVDLAEQRIANAHHLIITCNADGGLALRANTLRSAAVLVLPDATNDRGFAMTSSFTSMVLAAGLVFGVIHDEVVARVSRAGEALLPRVWALAQQWVERRCHRVVYLGSNTLGALAREAALKMLELTDGQTVAIANTPLGFRHGPKTIIDAQTLVVVMLSSEAHARAYDCDMLDELRRDARASAVVALGARAAANNEIEFPEIAEASDIERALLHILFAQGYALCQSLALGLTPDRPNAAGFVNRVVQGVTIHPWRDSHEAIPRR